MAFLPVLRKKAGVAEARHGCSQGPEKWGEKGLKREESHIYALLLDDACLSNEVYQACTLLLKVEGYKLPCREWSLGSSCLCWPGCLLAKL